MSFDSSNAPVEADVNAYVGDDTEVAIENPGLAESVVYVNSQGKQKAAIVIGTPQSVEDGHSVNVPEGDARHLTVFSYKGAYVRLNVLPEGQQADGDAFYRS